MDLWRSVGLGDHRLNRRLGSRRAAAKVVSKLTKAAVRGTKLSSAETSDQGSLDFFHHPSHEPALLAPLPREGDPRHTLVIGIGVSRDEPFSFHALQNAADRWSGDFHC